VSSCASFHWAPAEPQGPYGQHGQHGGDRCTVLCTLASEEFQDTWRTRLLEAARQSHLKHVASQRFGRESGPPVTHSLMAATYDRSRGEKKHDDGKGRARRVDHALTWGCNLACAHPCPLLKLRLQVRYSLGDPVHDLPSLTPNVLTSLQDSWENLLSLNASLA
jgi:hypothetical protein